MTVEAALLFPFVFLICILFMQYAMYFTSVEYVKSICNQGLIVWNTHGSSEGEEEDSIEQYLESRLSQSSFLQEDFDIQITQEEYLVFTRMEISVAGSYRLLFPMDIRVSAEGYREEAAAFCTMTDLVWECAERMDIVQEMQ